MFNKHLLCDNLLPQHIEGICGVLAYAGVYGYLNNFVYDQHNNKQVV
uniref:Uncharacterized protein n=1 Tax=Glossina brevipalpis TaxID=37001 RepID=A0A1A9WZH1_9MUSC